MSKMPYAKLSSKKLQKIQKNNGFKYNALKAIEELNELATVLAQSLTKSNKDTRKHTQEEIGDVYFRLGVLCNYYDVEQIHQRACLKQDKSVGYLKTKKYDKV